MLRVDTKACGARIALSGSAGEAVIINIDTALAGIGVWGVEIARADLSAVVVFERRALDTFLN